MTFEDYWADIKAFTYSRNSHLHFFEIPKRFQELLDDDDERVLKVYQDLFAYNFILRNIPTGACILEVGGGYSRVAPLLRERYDVWILDKYEGVGAGPLNVPKFPGVKIVQDYIGAFNAELQNGSFSCVFSISVWEHFPRDESALASIIWDIDRLLCDRGVSLHCVDIVAKDGRFKQAPYIDVFHNMIDLPHPKPDCARILADEDLLYLTERVYNRKWRPITGQEYRDFGVPLSYNVVYRKEQLKQTPRRPKVTIVTVTFNARAELAETIRSVAAQNYENLEYIVVDGGSTDDTLELIEEHSDAIDHWVSEPDSGIYHAMNKGIELASGEWINFTNAGDTLHDDEVLERLFSHPYGDAELIYGDSIFLRENGEQMLARAQPLSTFWMQINFNHNSLFVNAELMKEYGFNEHYSIVADSELIGRCLKEGRRFYYAPMTVNIYRRGGFSDQNSIKRTVERWKLMLDLGLEEEDAINQHYLKRLIDDPKLDHRPVLGGGSPDQHGGLSKVISRLMHHIDKA